LNDSKCSLSSDRRAFLTTVGRGALGVAALSVASSVTGRRLPAQEPTSSQSAASNVEMSSDSYKPVRRPPKASAKPLMDDKQIETFERELACPCPCTLDVFTCRTTDFNCGISPAVHKDVKALVEGGYSGDEIMAAMTDTYGDFILMTPRKQGFNLLAWFAPFAAIGIGAVAIGALLRGWRINAIQATAARAEAAQRAPSASRNTPSFAQPAEVDATEAELARLQVALRHDPQ